jgi:hypothetical protein
MGKEDPNTISRRDILKLAGTAAAFCTSFGFLHGSQTGGAVQDKHIVQDKHLQARWAQAEVKWYKGNELLHSSALPAKVVKHLGSNVDAVVEVKLFRSGQMLRNFGKIEAKI